MRFVFNLFAIWSVCSDRTLSNGFARRTRFYSFSAHYIPSGSFFSRNSSNLFIPRIRNTCRVDRRIRSFKSFYVAARHKPVFGFGDVK
jgi:hypothetical protein